MEVEEKLKKMMEVKSGNVRNFSIENEIPYTTVRSILERGVLNAKAETVFAICRALNINPETLVDEGSNKSNNIILGDNHGVNDNIDSHNESMKALGIADMKMSRALLNAQNETVKKLDRIIELLEEQNKILKK